MLLDKRLEFAHIGASEGGDACPLLVKLKRGHGTDAGKLGDLGELVNVDLYKRHVLVLHAQLVHLGTDLLARHAPGGSVVHDNLQNGDRGGIRQHHRPQKPRETRGMLGGEEKGI